MHLLQKKDMMKESGVSKVKMAVSMVVVVTLGWYMCYY